MTTELHASSQFLDRFLAVCERAPRAVAIEDLHSGLQTPYSELASRAEHIQGALAALGVKRGAPVMIVLPNGVPFVASLLACISREAVAVPASPALKPRELGIIIERATPVVVVTTREIASIHADAFHKHAKHVCAVDGPLPRVIDLTSLSAAPLPLVPPQGNPVVVRLFTFKGVGRPLGVEHRYRALMHCVDALHERFPRQGPDSVHLVVLPMYPVFGLSCALMLPLSVGARLLLLANPRAVDLPTVLEERRVQVFCLVPDIARLLLGQVQAARASQPNRRFRFHSELMLLSGGSYLELQLATACGVELGLAPIMQGYGTTEALPVMVESFFGPRCIGSIGQAIDGVRLRVRNADGQEARPGKAGELEVAGPTVAAGFIDEPELNARFFSSGWFRTGDLVRIDIEGHVEFLGRRLRFTKIFANMVDLAEVEASAEQLPHVRRARVAVRRNQQGRNGLVLVVVAEAWAELDEGAVLRGLREQLSSHKVPRRIHILREVAA